jgi:hypothetical protein
MNVGPYVPLPHRATERRCYFRYIAEHELAVFSVLRDVRERGGQGRVTLPASMAVGVEGVVGCLAWSVSLIQWHLSSLPSSSPLTVVLSQLPCWGAGEGKTRCGLL